MTKSDRVCTLLVDEMSIKSALKYDPHGDLVEGFEDWGWGRSQHPANSALVFMVRGLLSKWKQPLAYVLSRGEVHSVLLDSLVREALKQLMDVGLIPKVLICDQGSNNRSRALFRRLGITKESPYFTLDGKRIYGMYDPIHLMKSIRNNLSTHVFLDSGRIVSWAHIVSFFEQDRLSPIRLAPKLRKKHIELKNFAKLRVNLAVQVLSHSVAAGIATMVRLFALPDEAMTTASFVKRMDQLFNSFNSKSLRSKQVMGHAFSAASKHAGFLEETRKWMADLKCRNKTGTRPCLKGWQVSIKSLLMLWDDLHANHGFHYLLTDRLNQDCLENLFAVIRAKGGHRYNPSPFEFRTALRQTMVDALLVTSSRQNCKDDVDSFLFGLDHIPSLGSNTAVKSRLKTDVSKPLRPLMNVEPASTGLLSLQEDNVLVYIAGYIANKLSPLLCGECGRMLQGQADDANPHHTFLIAKGFTECTKGGLQAPSPLLFNICKEMESIFRQHSQQDLHTEGIRSSVIRRMHETLLQITPGNVECIFKTCDTLYNVISLYVNIRLHFLLKCKNEELALSARGIVTDAGSRKAGAFRHV